MSRTLPSAPPPPLSSSIAAAAADAAPAEAAAAAAATATPDDEAVGTRDDERALPTPAPLPPPTAAPPTATALPPIDTDGAGGASDIETSSLLIARPQERPAHRTSTRNTVRVSKTGTGSISARTRDRQSIAGNGFDRATTEKGLSASVRLRKSRPAGLLGKGRFSRFGVFAERLVSLLLTSEVLLSYARRCAWMCRSPARWVHWLSRGTTDEHDH
jgi:hypothetical protein